LKITNNLSPVNNIAVFGHTPIGIIPSPKLEVRYSEYIMSDFEVKLRKLTGKWRLTGEKTRMAAAEITNPMARGHMHGMSDGLDVAADDIDTLMDEPDLPIDPSEDSS
jgi:hypothetical protein